MGILAKLFPSSDTKIFVAAAKEAFEEVCAGESFSAIAYRKRPDMRDTDWSAIRQLVQEISQIREVEVRALRFRQELAKALEQSTIGEFYVNLSEDDQQVFAKHIWNSTAVESYPTYLRGLVIEHSTAYVLNSIIFAALDGDKDPLKEFRDGFIECCARVNQTMLKVARERAGGPHSSIGSVRVASPI